MPRLIVLLDVGGVINDKRQQTAQWQRLVGGYFAPLLGGAPEAWNEAHQAVTERFQDQGSAIAQAVLDFVSFHRTYKHYWLSGMCELRSLFELSVRLLGTAQCPISVNLTKCG